MSYKFTRLQRRARCYTVGRSGHRIKYATVHWWGDPATNPTFDGVVNWFKSGGGNNSAHVVLEAGRVEQVVAYTDTAWGNGNWESNCESIVIECNPRCSKSDLETLAEFIRDLRKELNIDLVITNHKDVSNSSTACPGAYYPAQEKLAPYFAALEGTPAKKKKSSSKSIDTLVREVIAGKYGNGNARKKALGSQYSAVQKRVNAILAGKAPAKPTAPAKKKSSSKSIDTLVREVIAGKYGNGNARKKALGSQYSAVQKRVNAILKGE